MNVAAGLMAGGTHDTRRDSFGFRVSQGISPKHDKNKEDDEGSLFSDEPEGKSWWWYIQLTILLTSITIGYCFIARNIPWCKLSCSNPVRGNLCNEFSLSFNESCKNSKEYCICPQDYQLFLVDNATLSKNSEKDEYLKKQQLLRDLDEYLK